VNRLRTAIFISGRGSNMAALIEAAQRPQFPAEIVLVLSDKSEATGLSSARSAGIATVVVDRKIYAGRDEFEAAVQVMVDIHRVELICLAGFMRVLGAQFVERWRGRLINIHPSLLPEFRGLNTHARAIAAGVKEHGCTVHFVEPELDAGPIVAQARLATIPGESEQALADRVLALEHELYPRALAQIAARQLHR
jgi:phosphoribosylglycinamide formyltransferase-1